MGRRSLRLGALVVFAAMATGLSLLAIAMHLYPGGTERDPQCVGHSFWFNFLCDLMGDRALNGALNPGRGFALAAMTTFGIGMGAFWMILPAEFSQRRATAAVVRVSGAISVLGFLAVPIAGGTLHAVAVFAAAGPGVLAAGVALVATIRFVRYKLLVGAASASIAVAVADSILYARRVIDDYRSCPPALPVLQRLTLLFVLLWAGTAAMRAGWAPTHPAGSSD